MSLSLGTPALVICTWRLLLKRFRNLFVVGLSQSKNCYILQFVSLDSSWKVFPKLTSLNVIHESDEELENERETDCDRFESHCKKPKDQKEFTKIKTLSITKEEIEDEALFGHIEDALYSHQDMDQDNTDSGQD